jgi:hypothetical protein
MPYLKSDDPPKKHGTRACLPPPPWQRSVTSVANSEPGFAAALELHLIIRQRDLVESMVGIEFNTATLQAHSRRQRDLHVRRFRK